MTLRSTPAFAIGGVPWFNEAQALGRWFDPGPACGWRCFHCNCHFTDWRAAARHFGVAGVKSGPLCREDVQ